MATNPAPFFEQVIWQLTKAEWVAICQAHSGLGTPTDPPQGASDYSPLGLTEYWGFSGQLDNATHTTPRELFDAHKALWQADGNAYLLPGVTNATRRARLLLGSWLITPNNTPRRADLRCFCYKLPLQPKPAGWIRDAFCFWNNESDPNAQIRVATENASGGNTNYFAISQASNVVAYLMGLPAGCRVLQWNFPKYKYTIPGGPFVMVHVDGQRTGGWPGLWLEYMEAGLETSLGAMLDALVAAGLTSLDWFITDLEYQLSIDKLRDPGNYYPHPNYRIQVPTGPSTYFWRDTINNETWHENFTRLIQTTYADWATEYNCPNVDNLAVWGAGSVVSPEAMQWNECWFHYHRHKQRAIRNIVLARFPNCKLREYDDTFKVPGYYSTQPAKRWGSKVGGGGSMSHATGRNLYASNQPWPNAALYFPGAGDQVVTTTAYVQFVTDSLTLDMCVAGSTLPQAPLNTAYTQYPAFSSPPNINMAYCHHVMSAMAADPCMTWWEDGASTLAAQNLLQSAIVAAEGYSRGVIGRNLIRPPRSNWNLSEPIIKENLCSGYVVTNTYYPDGTMTSTERVNVINHAPVITQPSDASGTQGVAFSKQIVATDPDFNNLTFSLTAAPGWMSIHPTTGLISGTPTAEGQFTVTVHVVDDDTTNGVQSDEKSFTLNIAGPTPNSAPVFNPIGNKSVAEGSLLSFTVTAEDPEDHVITFSLDSGPGNAAISSGGAFTYTPTESEGPGVYQAIVRATDNGSPPQSSTAGFSITVTEVNVAPTLASISNQTISEGDILSLSASGSDTDVPSNTLTYSLDVAPSGMTISSATGAITWVTNETHGSTTPYNVTVRVSDGTLSATRSFTVTVNEVNVAPSIVVPAGDLGATEDMLLTFQCVAEDTDTPANSLTWTLTGSPPSGASVTTGGLFTWTPPDAGEFDITFRVNDGTVNVDRTITVTVSAGNHPPVLAAIADKSVAQGQVLTFTASATDPDAGDVLTYSLDDAPTGASIGATSGVFTWQPTANQVGEHEFSVIVTDDGTPPFSDSRSVRVNVTAPATNNMSIDPIPVLNAVEGELLAFSIVGRDALGSSTPFTYSIADLPHGMTLDSASGAVRWTPSVSQSGNTYVLECQAYKGSPGDRLAVRVVTIVVHRNPTRRTAKQHPALLGTIDKRPRR